MDRLEARVERFEEKVDKRFDRLEAQIADLRSDLTRIALALGPEPRPQTG
jgi:hypothetical protein